MSLQARELEAGRVSTILFECVQVALSQANVKQVGLFIPSGYRLVTKLRCFLKWKLAFIYRFPIYKKA